MLSLNVLSYGLFRVKLHPEGETFVGALDGFDNIHAIGESNARHLEMSSRHITYDLMMP